MAVITYKCPGCGSTLSFDPKTQTLSCKNCGGSYQLSEIKKLNDNQTETFDFEKYKLNIDLDSKLNNTKIYQCTSCGAEIEASENTVATTCPYCDNNVVLVDRVSNGLRPNAIIPFKIKKEDLPGLIARFYENKRFLPNKFISKKEMDSIQGVYVPFWLFSATIEGDASFNGYKERTYTDGDYEVTERSHYRLERSGNASYALVPIDGSAKMDDDLMDSIEPFRYSDLVKFDEAYLTGYVCDRFDRAPNEEFVRARSRMINSTVSSLHSTISSYHGVSLDSCDLDCYGIECKYVFLPVYLLNCKFEGKKYRYAINGQTGKVVGELPISKLKMLKFFLFRFLIICLGLALIFTLIGYLVRY